MKLSKIQKSQFIIFTPIIVYVILWCIQEAYMVHSLGMRYASETDDPIVVLIVFIGVFITSFPFKGAPFILITYICEKMKKRGVELIELKVNMATMTILCSLVATYAILIPIIHSDQARPDSGWAFISFGVYALTIPLVFASKIIGDKIYAKYYKPSEMNNDRNKNGVNGNRSINE